MQSQGKKCRWGVGRPPPQQVPVVARTDEPRVGRHRCTVALPHAGDHRVAVGAGGIAKEFGRTAELLFVPASTLVGLQTGVALLGLGMYLVVSWVGLDLELLR